MNATLHNGDFLNADFMAVYLPDWVRRIRRVANSVSAPKTSINASAAHRPSTILAGYTVI